MRMTNVVSCGHQGKSAAGKQFSGGKRLCSAAPQISATEQCLRARGQRFQMGKGLPER